MRRHLFWAILAVAAVVVTMAAPALAQDEAIDTYGAQCFTYQGYTYVPLRSAADFVGASLTWHEARSQVSVFYRGNDLLLVIGSASAYFNDRPVRLPVVPVSINGTVMVPVTIFDEYLDTSVRWAADENRVYLLGSPGWGYYDVLSYTPDYALSAFQAYNVTYQAAPFYYNNICYVPLLDWCDYLGFPIFFEPDYDDFVCNYHGTEVVLFLGRNECFFGPRAIALSAAPCIVRNTVFVPLDFFTDPLRVPVQREGGLLRLRGETGMRQIHVADRPAAPISVSLPRQPQLLGIPTRPAVLPGIVTRVPRQQVARGGAPSFPRTAPRPAPAPQGPGAPSAPPRGRSERGAQPPSRPFVQPGQAPAQQPAPRGERAAPRQSPAPPRQAAPEQPASRGRQGERFAPPQAPAPPQQAAPRGRESQRAAPPQAPPPQQSAPRGGQGQRFAPPSQPPQGPPPEQPGGERFSPVQPGPPPQMERPAPPSFGGGGPRGGGVSPGRAGGGRRIFADPAKGKSVSKDKATAVDKPVAKTKPQAKAQKVGKKSKKTPKQRSSAKTKPSQKPAT
jgi:hypothetical protein